MSFAEINRLGGNHNPNRLRRDNHTCFASWCAMSAMRLGAVFAGSGITTRPTAISSPPSADGEDPNLSDKIETSANEGDSAGKTLGFFARAALRQYDN
jgi:hypothetical protein